MTGVPGCLLFAPRHALTGQASPNPQMTSCNRLCPSVEGSASPLITHRIGVEVCLARQRTFYHKCHRCIYRGQAATWEPDQSSMATINMQLGEEIVNVGVKRLTAAPARDGKPGRAKGAAGKESKAAKLAKTAEAGS